MKVKVTMRKRAQKEQFGNEWSLPVLALEKVFFYLDWKDLGRAMLVCHRWKEVGGHPSLWTRFPLRLEAGKFPKIRRLDWVKSATIRMSDAGFESIVTCIQAAIEALPRLEELFIVIICGWDKFYKMMNDEDQVALVMKLLKTDKNKLARVAVASPNCTQCYYYVSSCDTDSTTFLKKTLKIPGKEKTMSIYGLPGVCMSNEMLETLLCTTKGENVSFYTNLMIDQNMDLGKLTCLMMDHVKFLSWDMNPEDWRKQEAAPVNAILDLLGSKNNGIFEELEVPKILLLKSGWVGRLGGRGKVESLDRDFIHIAHAETGLVMEDGEEDEDDEDEDDDDEDDDDEDDEDDVDDEDDEDDEDDDNDDDNDEDDADNDIDCENL